MTRSRYGWLAGVAGAAFAAWWWRRRDHRMAGTSHQPGARGEVIFRNTPEPTGATGLS